MTNFPQLVKTAYTIIYRDGWRVFFKRFSIFLFGLSVSNQPDNIDEVEYRKQSLWKKDVPLVSVVIPCYNYGRFIREALNSVLAQSFQGFEILVINDGSTDEETMRVLSGISHPKVRVVSQENQGLAQTRNNGMEMARGKYVCFLDADDSMESTYLEKTLIVLERNQHLGSTYSWLQCFGGDTSIWKTQDLNSSLMRHGNIAPSHSVIRRSVWVKVKSWNSYGFLTRYNGFFEDWVFWIDMVSLGFGGKVIPETLIRYRIHDGSLSAQHKPRFQEMLATLKKDRRSFFYPSYFHLKTSKRIGEIKSTNAFANLSFSQNFICFSHAVVFFLPWLACGGVEAVTLGVIRHLRRSGFTVVIVTTERSSHEWRERFAIETPYIYHLDHYLDRKEYALFIENFFNVHNVKVACGIHSSLFYELIPMMRHKLKNVKLLDVLHNDSTLGYIDESSQNDQYIDEHIVVTERIRTSLVKKGASDSKITAIYNGIDTADEFNPTHYPEKNDNGKLQVIFVGRLSPEKRPLDFVRLAEKFSRENRISWVLVGDGELMPAIRKAIRRKKLGNIHVAGMVESASYLAASDVLVLPSEVEGFPLVVLESMALNNAVLSTDVGEVGRILGSEDSGYLNPIIGDIDFFADKIRFYLNNRDILKQHQQRARQIVITQYDVAFSEKKYQQIFSDAINGKGC